MSEPCGALLNQLHEPCYLARGHEGPHEGIAVRREQYHTYRETDVLVRWMRESAPAAERVYFNGPRP